MKTKEFIRRVEDELGYVTGKSENYINIRKEGRKFGELFAMVAFNKVLSIDTSFHNFTSLDKHEQDLFFNLILEYARTPLEEREEEKKYVYKFPFNVIYETKKDLYVFKILDGGLNLSNAEVHDPKVNNRYHFTNKEVEKFTGKDRELFNVCEKIEVTP